MRLTTTRLPSLIAALVLVAGLAAGPAAGSPSWEVTADPESKRITVAIDPRDVTFTALPGGDELLALAGSADRWMAAGAPDLPVVRLVVRIEDDLRVDAAHVVSERTAALGRHRLAPAPAPVPEGEAARLPDPAVYGADRTYPDRGVLVEGEGFLRGNRLVHVVLFPLRANPVSGEVELATEMTIELTGASGAATEPRPRAVPWEAKVEATLERVAFDLRGGAARGKSAPLPAGSVETFWSPTYRPTTDGSAVEYVIVTSAALESSFQALADWKTKKGVQAVVRTMEWISDSYPGVDRAEQLRTFLLDAYENWGTLWVLLGGDSDVIPVRYAAHSLTNPPELIPADLYFSCLNGNWNADGDELFGEGIPPGHPAGGDSADFLPEVYVGRAPVSNAAAATAYIAKIQDYERGLGLASRYPNSALLLGEVLAPGLDGGEFCEDVRQRLPAGMRLVRMYENYQAFPGAIPELRGAVIDSLQAGFGLVHHVGHGYRNTMSVGDGTLSNSDIDNLTNGNRQSVVYAINCSSAAFDFASIGERFLKNPGGGGVIYIGSSRVAFSGESRPFQNEFYRVVFADSVTSAGEAAAWSKIPFIGGSESETAYRWIQFALTLLGDPELPIWRRAPDAIAAASPVAVPLGAGSYTVTATVGGVPLGGARVALWKSGEAFAMGETQPDGVATVPWTPAATGVFNVTVSHPDYRPVEKTATVAPASGPFLHITPPVTINDDGLPPSAGNANGQPDAGERIELSVRLRNDGSATATGVSAILTVLSGGTYASIFQGSVSYGTIAVGGQSTGTGPFVIDLARGAPDAFEPVFQIAIVSGQGAFSDRFEIAVRGHEIEHYTHLLSDPGPGGNGNGVPEPGEAVSYRVTARNNGTGRADGIAFTLRVLNRNTMAPDPLVSVTDANAGFGNVSPGATSLGDPVAFTLGASAVVNNLLLELSWRDVRGALRIELCDLVPPDPVDTIAGDGRVSSIRLHWAKPDSSDVRGYDIYRSTTPQGGFARINSFTAFGSSTFEDSNLPSLTRFYYYVVARDASFNESVASPVISATTTPQLASGWPIEMGQQTASGVVIDDLDGDGDLEIVTGADAIYAWHDDGAEVRDGDANPLTSGVFATDGQNGDFGFHATPAIADLTGDGDLEIIGLAWREAKVYVWNVDGTLEPGWPQTIGGDFNWASPAVADLDRDGDLEIIAASGLQGKIFAWHHDGTEVADGDGNPTTNGVLFVTSSSFLYSSPAIGNIDQDPDPEIVFGTQSAGGFVYALSRTGSVEPGWPRETHSQVTASPALADLDRDGRNEVIVSSEIDSVFVLRGDGTDYPGWPRPAMVNSGTGHTSSPVVADVDGDGNLDVIFAANDGRMHVWKRDGTVMPGWSAVVFGQDVLNEDVTQSTPTVADVDSDGRLEIVIGAENGFIYGWNHDGTALAGFPISCGAEQRSAVTIWDVDHDGRVELLATSNDRNMYVWDLTGEFRGDRIPWPFFRHDVRNSGCFSTNFTSIGIADPEPAPELSTVPVLYPAFPNPFNPATTIRFLVPGERGAARPVRLAIYDVEGRLVRELVDGPFGTGEQAVRWDGRTVSGGRAASGAYFMKLEVAGTTRTGKLIMLQ